MIICPLCVQRIPTGDDRRQTGDCQCSREKLARSATTWRTAALEIGRDSIRDAHDWQAKAQAAGWRPPHV